MKPGASSRICEVHGPHVSRGTLMKVTYAARLYKFSTSSGPFPPISTHFLVMVWFRRWLLVALAASAVSAEQVQIPGLQVPASAAANQATVKAIFARSYEAYKYVRALSLF